MLFLTNNTVRVKTTIEKNENYDTQSLSQIYCMCVERSYHRHLTKNCKLYLREKYYEGYSALKGILLFGS